MKTILAAALALITTTGVAFASDPVSADRSGLYVGGSVGKYVQENNRFNFGADVGYQVGPNLRLELDYTHAWQTHGVGQTLFGNVIGQYRLPNSTVTPYVLAGVGMGFDNVGQVKTGNMVGLYDFGAGARVAVSKSVEIDVRYTNNQPFNTKQAKHENVFTVGMNYRF